MTFLIEYTVLVHKWQYAMTKRLKEIYPGARFIAMINAADPQAIESYLTREGIRYEEIIDIKDYWSRFAEEKEIDPDLIHRFEETLPGKSLWRLVAIDRDWGSAFVKTAIRTLTHINTINNQENILRTCQHLIKFYQRLFDKYRPDVVLPSNGMNNLNCAIMEQFAKNYQAHYLVPETIRALGYISFATTKEQNFPHIYPQYLKLLETPGADISVGEQMYDEMMEDLRKEEYYDKLTLKKFRGTAKMKYLLKVPYQAFRAVVGWVKMRPGRSAANTIFKYNRDLKTLWSIVKYEALRPYQVMTLMEPKFFSPFDPDKKYVYFPLSSTPEHSTQVKAPMWINQLFIIEALAKSIPSDWVIYVKEHPQNLICRLRDFRFYKELKSYPNVRLIITDTNFFDVIKKAQLIINITGTTGWQAIQFNKPVISLGENFYDMLGLSLRLTDIEQFARGIHEAIDLANSVSLPERRRRMACLLTALRKHSFQVDHPWKLMGDIVADDKDSRIIGEAVADCMHSFLSDEDYRLRARSPMEQTV